MQSIIEVMQNQLWFYLTTVGLISLCIGSFLNVVIYRLPLMMQREWQRECRLLLEDELTANKSKQANINEPFNLVKPNSTCPKCKTAIKPWQNIPIISWLALKGKCASCSNPISARYPAVELITALLSLIVAYSFGATEQTLLYIFVTWILVALTFIDIDHMLLPDQLTLPMVWLALIASVMGYTITPTDAIIGAACGYLSLWSVFWLFKLLTGKEGMGYGDFKLLAVSPINLFIASSKACSFVRVGGVYFILSNFFKFSKVFKSLPPPLILLGFCFCLCTSSTISNTPLAP